VEIEWRFNQRCGGRKELKVVLLPSCSFPCAK
jgi:hypothetical protein